MPELLNGTVVITNARGEVSELILLLYSGGNGQKE